MPQDIDEALAAYVPTDDFFGAPFVDRDEERSDPIAHRYVHGGFAETATRFSIYFPPDGGARFFQFLEGGGGTEDLPLGGPGFKGMSVPGFPWLPYMQSRGGFFVHSNQGHAGNQECPKAGDDMTVYAYRASAECARLARHLAAAVYGEAPGYGYLFGDSGGGMRTLAALEHVDDETMPWEAGVAGLHAGDNMRCWSAMNNVLRVLGDRLALVVDAIEPGGSGDPFAGLTTTERDVLAHMYACGFPRGAERHITNSTTVGVIPWPYFADSLVAGHSDYFRDFWTTPGHAGADGLLDAAVVDTTVTVAKVLTADEAAAYGTDGMDGLVLGQRPDQAVAIVVSEELPAPARGARLTIVSGAASGRELYCTANAGGLLAGGSIGAARATLFDGVEPGDEVRVDNRDYLAYCHYSLHHTDTPQLARRLFVDGHAIHPQHPVPESRGSFWGQPTLTGAVKRPLIVLMHAYDTLQWAPGGVVHDEERRTSLGEAAEERYRCWWLDQTEHVPPSAVVSETAEDQPVPSTWLNDYGGAHEFALDAAAAWVERDVAPPGSTGYVFDRVDMSVRYPMTVAERRGIQPIVTLRANGGVVAEVVPGEEIVFAAQAEAPEGVGGFVELAWDFDGAGTWPDVRPQTGDLSSVHAEARHAYDRAGTYFPAVRAVLSGRGDPDDAHAQIANLGRCRVIVR